MHSACSNCLKISKMLSFCLLIHTWNETVVCYNVVCDSCVQENKNFRAITKYSNSCSDSLWIKDKIKCHKHKESFFLQKLEIIVYRGKKLPCSIVYRGKKLLWSIIYRGKKLPWASWKTINLSYIDFLFQRKLQSNIHRAYVFKE